MPNDQPARKKETNDSQIMDRAVEILTAYLSNPTTHLNHDQIPAAYRAIRDVLKEDTVSAAGEEKATELKPAVPIKKSVTDDYIVCLECGGHYKSLKRHLNQKYNLTTDQYREKWGLPDDYPLVAANYSKQRSELAFRNGLGELRKKDRQPKP